MKSLRLATLAQIQRLLAKRDRWHPNLYAAEIDDLLVCLRNLRS
jgi:hypothetical protein